MGVPIIGIQAAQRAQALQSGSQDFRTPSNGNIDSPEMQQFFSPTPQYIQYFSLWQNTGPQSGIGMLVPGNTDLTRRPLVIHSATKENPEGGVSTIYSYTIKTPDNKWLVVPGVTKEGRMLKSEDEAFDYYRQTGEHLGLFNTLKNSDIHANLLHEKAGAFQRWKNGGKYNPSIVRHEAMPAE